ncbi:MAG: hypothetical protein GX112_02460 [Clostridiaceae bacterium]|jgi:membrane-bound ClpP family serine protease|nr:hypothetical protein [Clostridiaceae bacterium]
MSDMTLYLNVLAISIAGLTVLILMINAAILLLRPIARRHAAKTDLDQVGQKATVVKSIRPGRPGQIRYRTEEGYHQADAEADNLIRNGRPVLILSVAQNRFRVRPLTEEEQAAARRSDAPVRDDTV